MELDFNNAREYNAGSLSLDGLTEGARTETARLFVGVDACEVDNYIKSLQEGGYSVVYDRKIEGQRYVSLSSAEGLIHLSNYDDGSLIVTRELNAISTEELSYTSKECGSAAFYMYGVNMDPGGYNPSLDFSKEDNTSGFVNCGMLLAIRSSDDSIIVIDGGKASQFPGGGIPTLNRFLHKIARKSLGEVVRISAWFISHAHDDHYEGFAAMLDRYHEQYNLERIISNFPERKVASFPKKFPLVVETVRAHFPDVIDYKAHTGDVITLGDVRLNVLYTHENTLNDAASTLVEDYNDTTTVIRADVGDMRVMILGDISELAEERIVGYYTSETLRSDIVQVAHHNFNHLVKIYEPICAPIACFTQTLEGTRKNESTRSNAKPVLETSKEFYYNGDITKTVGFAMVDGKVAKTFSYPDMI